MDGHSAVFIGETSNFSQGQDNQALARRRLRRITPQKSEVDSLRLPEGWGAQGWPESHASVRIDAEIGKKGRFRIKLVDLQTEIGNRIGIVGIVILPGSAALLARVSGKRPA